MLGSESTTMPIECRSRDGITIGLIDSLITIAVVLDHRLKSERRRFRRSADEWAYHSQAVQDALHDLADNPTVRGLLWPHDDKAMAIIHSAAQLLGAKEDKQ